MTMYKHASLSLSDAPSEKAVEEPRGVAGFIWMGGNSVAGREIENMVTKTWRKWLKMLMHVPQ